MVENEVKNTCGGAKLEVKIKKDEKIQNLTRWIFLNSKSDALYLFEIKF